jgi:hypothetical protein
MIVYPAISPLTGDRHAPEQVIGMTGLGDRHRPDSLIDFNGIRKKTMTGKKLGRVKLIWTVDAGQALQEYIPCYDTILVHINWGSTGWLVNFRNISPDWQREIYKIAQGWYKPSWG